MGAVYVVEHRITGKRLALKCLLPEHLAHPEFSERFLREAQAAGRIQHRNVVDVFDVGQDGEVPYIVMELLEGKSLADLLREGKLTLEETLQIVLRAAEGVCAAHQVGIVHRDLKPDNIFVCFGQSGQLDDPRVLDFGISKLEDDLSKPLTKSGVMLGTPYYMAFEQINSQRDLDQRVDVYAMGVILYEACSGQPPYVAESVGALAIRMMTAPPIPLSQLRPELPEGLTDVVMRCIARDRDQRFPTMQALVDALRPFASDSSALLVPRGQGTPLGASLRSEHAVGATLPAVSSAPPSGMKSSARLKLRVAEDHVERTPAGASSSRTLLWIAAAVLLLVGGGVLLALRNAGSAEGSREPVAAEPPALPKAARTDRAVAKKPERAEQPTTAAEAPVVERVDAERAAPDEAPERAAVKGRRKLVRGREAKSLPTAAAPAPASGPAVLAPPPETKLDQPAAPTEAALQTPQAAAPEVEPLPEPATPPAPETPTPEAPPDVAP